VAYNSELANKFFFNSRVRVTFTVAGETDGGMAFGGSFGANDAVGAAAGTAGSVFIRGSFGRLTMGDVAGAAELVAGDAGASVGYTELGGFQEAAYLSNPAGGRPAARYEYTMDGFTGAISATNPGVGNAIIGVGVGYSANGYSVGLGYEDGNNAKHIVVRASATFEGVTVGAMYGRLSVGAAGPAVAGVAAGAKGSQYGLNVAGTFDETTVRAYYQKNFAGAKSYGIGAAYNLGGGATLQGGIVSTNVAGAPAANTFGGVGGATRRTLADFGLTFTF